MYNGVPVKTEDITKHLGVCLDEKLTFRIHVGEKIVAANKGLALLKFLSKYTNSSSLSMLYKMHVRLHLDYGDIIYHNRLSECSDVLESFQYKASLIVAGCWKGTNHCQNF